VTTTSKPLISAKYAANADTTEYTAGTATRTIIDKLTGYNSDTVTQTLTVNLVASAGAAGASNIIVVKAISAGETYTFPEIVGHVLEAGGIISIKASAASKIVIRASGREVT